MIGADDPISVVTAHAAIADQCVHQRLLEGVAHVQGAGHIRWWKLDAIAGLGRVRTGLEIACLLPFRVPVRFDGNRIKCFGERIVERIDDRFGVC